MDIARPTAVNFWGAAPAVHIPERFLDALGIKIKEKVEIKLDKDKIIISKIKSKSRSLEEIFANWDGGLPDNHDEIREWEAMEAVGGEIL